jgi:hypothetical protein
MPETTTTTDTTVAQVVLLTGRRHGSPPPCIGCARSIDTDDDYYVCRTGWPRRPEVLAAAHLGHWRGEDDYDDTCPAALRRFWEKVLADIGAGQLRLGTDAGGKRFHLGDVALHAGAAVEVLTPAGTWQAARFEYDTTTWSPKAHVALGGWDAPEVAFTLPPGAVLRLPPVRL